MRIRTIALALLALTAAAPVSSAFALSADHADDVCAPAANPCNVTTEVDVVNNSTLDFGTRTVNVTGGGRFDFDNGSGTILLGKLLTNTSGAAINARGAGGLPDTTESGLVQIEARRACSSGSRACVGVNDCQLGACSARRCSLKPTRTCTDDSSCQLGTCIPPGMPNARRCTLNTTVRCSTNTDCQLGTCPEQLTCAGEADSPVNCSSNTDCNFGTCSVGEGTMDINSTINGSSDQPAIITLRAADDVTLRKIVNLSSDALETDGGQLVVDAIDGDIQLLGKINLLGGADGAGGAVSLTAGGNVLVNDDIDATGGDFDGGEIDSSAGVDTTINADVLVSSIAGAGFGGNMLFVAGRDITATGVSAVNKTRFAAEGHTDATLFAGDGGGLEFDTGRHLRLNSNTLMELNGSAPDGFGGELLATVRGDFYFNGEVQAKTRGLKGAGGDIEISVDGASNVDSAGVVDAFGGEAGGGNFDLLGDGNITFSGRADVSAGGGGAGGTIRLESRADARSSGDLTSNGVSGGDIDMTACRLRLLSGALLDNDATGADNLLTARESMRLDAGSQVLAAGQNIFTYRAANKPPVINGTVSPAPILIVDSDLNGCPVCGNSEIDETETCDDGNTQNGDGCSSDCQNENCIAQTPGYPAIPLCSDDNGCTTDTCNTALNGGTCQHSAGCNDAIDCTTDVCVGDACVFTPADSACVDDNPCTDGVCNAQTGCSFVPNNDSCDDLDFCTVGDTCSNSQCGGLPRSCEDGIDCTVDTCDESADECVSTPSHDECSDGVFCDGAEVCDVEAGCIEGDPVDCTIENDQCNEGVCNEATDSCDPDPINEGENCDDGSFCTVNDTCQSGVCAGVARDCADSIACTIDSCDEELDACVHQGSDGLCQDDVFCDGSEICNVDSGCMDGTPPDCSGSSGSCALGVCDEVTDGCVGVPTNEGQPCDDGQFCTVTDVCDTGVCTGDVRDCSDLDDQCHEGVCNEDANACEAQNANEGGGCDDQDACTETDICTGGVCAGTEIPGCGAVCGNGETEFGEDCDDGNTQFSPGQFCGADCLRVPCGKPTDSSGTNPNATDALFTLRAAVGLAVCDPRLCNVDNNGSINATDSLRVLRKAVGQPGELICPTTV
ncbi:MAG TPA: hypothetical protein VEC57_16795 [Candidatus Limnocylindrales bacterium]|nr:hypothetical protein [Candidatus Limnocylindrales bacterium]